LLTFNAGGSGSTFRGILIGDSTKEIIIRQSDDHIDFASDGRGFFGKVTVDWQGTGLRGLLLSWTDAGVNADGSILGVGGLNILSGGIRLNSGAGGEVTKIASLDGVPGTVIGANSASCTLQIGGELAAQLPLLDASGLPVGSDVTSSTSSGYYLNSSGDLAQISSPGDAVAALAEFGIHAGSTTLGTEPAKTYVTTSGSGTYHGRIGPATGDESSFGAAANNTSFALIKAGSGTLTLTNEANSYAGGTTIRGGYINFKAIGTLGPVGTILLDGGGLQWATGNTADVSSRLSFGANGGNLDTNGNNVTFSASPSGNGTLTKTGAGVLSFGAGSFAGKIVVEGGTLQFTASTSGIPQCDIKEGGRIYWTRASDTNLLNRKYVFDGGTLEINAQNNGHISSINLSGRGTLIVDSGWTSISGDAGNVQALVFGSSSTVAFGAGSLIDIRSGTINGADNAANAANNMADLNVGPYGRFDMRGLNISFGGITGTGYIVRSQSGTSTLTIGRGVTAEKTHTFAGTITGTNSGVGTMVLDPRSPLDLVKIGAGTQIFTGNFVPTTLRIDGGKVVIGDGAVLSFKSANLGNVTVSAGGTLEFARSSSALTVVQSISGAGNLVKSGSSKVIYSPANNANLAGNITIEGGTLRLENGQYPFSNVNTHTITIKSGATLEYGRADIFGGSEIHMNIPMIIEGTLWNNTGTGYNQLGVVTMKGGTIHATGGYTDQKWQAIGLLGNVTVLHDAADGDAETISAITSDTSGSGLRGIHLGNQRGNNVSAITFNVESKARLNISAQLVNRASDTSAGKLIKAGAGILQLSNVTNSYTGGTEVTGGLINFRAASNFGTGGANVLLNGGGLQWATGVTEDISSRLAALGAGGGTLDTNGNNITLGTSISGTGALTKAGAGTLILSASNSYSGGTKITGGFIQFSNSTSFGGTGANVTLDGGGLRWATSSSADISSRLAAVGTGGGTLDTNGNDVILASDIQGTGKLTKIGVGTLALSGTNAYSGGTEVKAGTIEFSAATNFGGTGANVTLNGGGLRWATSSSADISSRLAAVGTGGGTLDTNGNDVTLASGISGAGALAKVGAGTLTLSGTSTHTGNMTVDAGALKVTGILGNGSYAGNITLTGGPITFDQTDAQTLSGTLSGTGSFTKAGTGALTLTGTNMLSGGMIVKDGGVLAISADANLGVAYDSSTAPNAKLTLGDTTAGTLRFATGATVARPVVLAGTGGVFDTNGTNGTLSGEISGSAPLTKANAGTLTLSGSSTYSGDTTVSAGRLEVTGSLGSGSYAGAIHVTGGVLALNQAGAQTLSGVISGGGTLAKSGAGVLTLSGSNTYTGDMAISGGTLLVTGSLGSGSYAGAIHVTGGVLALNQAGAQTLSGVISGGGTLAKSGVGVLTLSGTNTHTGGATISNGFIHFTTLANLGNGAGNVTLDGGGLRWASGSSVDISNKLAPLGSNGGTLDTNGNDVTLSTRVTGTGGLTKAGVGKLVLAGASTYAGDTTVSAGTLEVTGTLGASASYGGNISLSGTTITFAQGSAQTLSGDITGTGSVVKTGAGILKVAGTVAVPLSLAAGSTLGGTGTVESPLFDAGSKIAPGMDDSIALGSTGTLTLGKVATQVALNDVQLDIFVSGSSSSDKIFVAGDAEFANLEKNTVNVSDVNSMWKAGTYTILEAGGTLSIDPDLLAATVFKYHGVEIGHINTRMGASLALVGKTLVLTTLPGYSADIAWDVHSQPSAIWDNGFAATANWAESGMSGERFQNGDLVTFANAGTLTRAVRVQTANGGVIAGKMTVTGQGYVFTGGKIAGVSTASIGAISSFADGSLFVASTGEVRFENALYFKEINVQGMATFANEVTAGEPMVVSNGATVVFDTGARFTDGASAILRGIVNQSLVVFNETATKAFGAPISGQGRVVKQGAGVLLLTGANAFTGGVQVEAGTLAIAAEGALGAAYNAFSAPDARLTLGSTAARGVLRLDADAQIVRPITLTGQGGGVDTNGHAVTIAGSLAGTSLAKVGAGTLTVSSAAEVSTSLEISGGTLLLRSELGSGNVFGGSITLANGSELALAQPAEQTLSGDISGVGSLVKTGSNTLILSGSNTFSGGVYAAEGVLAVNSDVALGATAATLTLGDAVVGTAATLRFNGDANIARPIHLAAPTGAIVDTNGHSATLSGALTGAALEKAGDGTLTFGNSTHFTGALTLSRGTVEAGAANVFNALSSIEVHAGALLDLGTYSQSVENAITLAEGGRIHLGTGAALLFIWDASAGARRLDGEVYGAGTVDITAGGRLEVNGQITSAFRLSSGTLSGTGLVAKPAFQPGTRIAPGANGGNSVGTLTLGQVGTTTALNGVEILFDAAPGASDFIIVEGDASFGVVSPNTINITDNGANFWHTGSFPLLAATGTLTTGNLAATVFKYRGVVMDGVSSRVRAQVFSPDGQQLVVETYASANLSLTWDSPASTGVWDKGTSANWREGDVHGLFFNDGDNVRFSSDPNTAQTIHVNTGGAGVIVGGMTLSQSTYIFNGDKIAGLLAASSGLIVADGRLRVDANAIARFNNEVDFPIVDIAGTVTFGTHVAADSFTVAGRVTFGNGGVIAIPAIANSGTVVFDRNSGFSDSYGGRISGGGAVVKTGSGSLSLSGASTFSGGVRIEGGTLVAAHATNGVIDALGTGTVDTGPEPTLIGALRIITPGEIRMPITGAGSVEISASSGTVVFTTAATYTGSTVVRSSTLKLCSTLGTNGVYNAPISLDGGSSLVFAQAYDQVLTGGIIGTGTLTKQGAATLTLADPTQSYKFTKLCNEAGTLLIKGELKADTIENYADLHITAATLPLTPGSAAIVTNTAGARLMADGLIMAREVHNSGLLIAPEINGTVINNASGTVALKKEISRHIVDGTLRNDGLVYFGAFGQSLRIGSLANATPEGIGKYSLEIDFNDPEHSDRIHLADSGNATGQHEFAIRKTFNAATTTRQTTVNLIEGGRIDPGARITLEAPVEAGLYTFDIVGDGSAVLRATGLSELAQTIGGATGAGTFATAWFGQLDNINKRLGELRVRPSQQALDNSLWFRARAQRTNITHGIREVPNFHEYQYGADIGGDKTLTQPNASFSFLVGIHAGYSLTQRTLNASRGKTETSTFASSLYSAWQHKNGLFASATAQAECHDSTLKTTTDRSQFDNFTLGFALELGWHLTFGDAQNPWFLEPSLQGSYAHVFAESYNTRQSLRVRNSDTDIERLGAILRAGKTFSLESSGTLVPYLKLGAEYRGGQGGAVRVLSPAATERWTPDFDGALVQFGFGLTWQSPDTAHQVHFDYEATHGSRTNSPWTLNAGYRWRF
jgi:autotransporter-associated beta strand protein